MTNFDEYLIKSFDKFSDNKVKEAMLYCIEGGKHFRPNVIFSILKGFNIPEEKGYDAACAIEYIHTYSLIHDDLPGMDNDDFRRGKLSCHKKFGEDVAILTGDALLTHSFSCIANSNYGDKLKVNLINILAKYAGLDGMIYGQLLDLTPSAHNDSRDLFEIQDNKTSGLFKLACLMAMYIAGNEDYDYFERLGSKIGVIFQEQDDLFDVIKTEEETGKTNSDIRNDKFTALKFYSVEELKEHIENLFNDLYSYLDIAPFNKEYLKEIIEKMQKR